MNKVNVLKSYSQLDNSQIIYSKNTNLSDNKISNENEVINTHKRKQEEVIFYGNKLIF